MSKEIFPPLAKKIPKELTIHNDIRIDNYFWLNEKENPEVIDYLEQENTYCDTMLSHTKDFQTNLFEEMKARIKEDDESVPYKYNGYWYIVKFEKGKDYPIYTRKKERLQAKEEMLFDCNKMAEGHTYFKLVGINSECTKPHDSHAFVGPFSYHLLFHILPKNCGMPWDLNPAFCLHRGRHTGKMPWSKMNS